MYKSAIWTIKKRGLLTFISAAINLIRIIFYRILNNRYIEKKIYNFRMILDINDKGLSRTLLLFGERELEQKYIIEKIIEPKMKILDLGSNIGYYALIFLKKINKNNIILVEPSPSNFELLKKNLILNNYQQVDAKQLAISDTDGKKDFFISEMSNLNTFHINKKDLSKYKKISVDSLSLESLLKEKQIDLIRMDIEGHEVSIFKSLIVYIQKYQVKPSILFEPHISKYNNENNMFDQLKKLFAMGYSLQVAASSSKEANQKFYSKNYKSVKSFNTDEKIRDIYLNISNKDALDFLSIDGGVRTALLSCKSEYKKFIE